MKKSLLLAALAALLFSSCESTPSEAPEGVSVEEEESADAIVTSFVFMGCNRIWWKDVQPNTSTANTDVLKNIFTHVANSGKQTDYFFFLGDIVTGEATDSVLNSQLYYWDEDYNNGVFSDFKSTGIKMIPVPGNHEMLNQNETPLAHTTDTWMKYMGKYMPADRDIVPDSP
ncbi:MAG: metallophosphoesterase family protein, partial [Crocinitomicaceae bacterium]